MRLGKKENKAIRFSTYPEIGHLELLHAAYKKHAFSPHFHEGHVIGVIEKGTLGFDYLGEKVAATAGEINIADPGEVHNGFSMSDQGWQYRMFYLKPGQLERICNDMSNRITATPIFQKGVIRDRLFAQKIHRLHRDFEHPGITLLEKESRFRILISQFILKYAQAIPSPVQPGSEPGIVRKIKAYIRAHYSEPIALADLSRIAGVSKYYLLRVFARETGMTPHAYLNHTRATYARQMMQNKVPIIDCALNVGFYDQSHLNRIFKKIYGITPGQYLSAL